MTKMTNLRKISPSKYEFKLDDQGNLELTLFEDAISEINNIKPNEVEYQIEIEENILSISINNI